MSRFKVTIDALALKGFAPEERKALVNGLQRELSRVLADPTARDAWEQSRRVPVLRLGRMPFEPGKAGGQALGRGMARAAGRRLKP
jgi:hypothetical protein